jgi:hypothetical protein
VKLYRYVGPRRIADRVRPGSAGVPIRSPGDVLVWVRSTDQELSGGCVIATFVVDAVGVLLIADRRSEHVACAGSQPVRSAGEITFAVGRAVEVTAVSNQSTGYCPEPESWPTVAAALTAAGLEPPAGLSLVCDFRRCVGCGNLTLVKGGVFECGVCGADLPAAYNCQPPDAESDIAPDPVS